MLKFVFCGGGIHGHSANRIFLRDCGFGRIFLHDRQRQATARADYILDSFAYAVDCCILERVSSKAHKLKLEAERFMTQLEVAYRYVAPPTEAIMRAMDNMREVYGIRRIIFNEAERIIRIEFDASRFKEPVIAGLLRRTGLDLGDQLVLA